MALAAGTTVAERARGVDRTGMEAQSFAQSTTWVIKTARPCGTGVQPSRASLGETSLLIVAPVVAVPLRYGFEAGGVHGDRVLIARDEGLELIVGHEGEHRQDVGRDS